MLSTTCWVLTGPSQGPIEGTVYLRREDANVALDLLQNSPPWKDSVLEVRERRLTLAFGVTDQRVTPEAVLKMPQPGPRRFELHRVEDKSGVSGTGVVAEGVEFFDGTVALRWKTEHSSFGNYDSMAKLEAIHGHGGTTRVVWLDLETSQ